MMKTVIVKELNGLVPIIFCPWAEFLCGLTIYDHLMMMLPWGRDNASGLGLAETGLGLSGSGSDVGGQSSGGRGEWPGTLTGPSSHPLRHPHPGTFIICHQHRGSGDWGVRPATDIEWPRQVSREMINVSFMHDFMNKSSKFC